MANIGKAVKRAIEGFSDARRPGEYDAGGKQVVCPHCGGTQFGEGRAQLHTAGMTFFDLEWLNESATTLACIGCGHLQWFLKRPNRRETDVQH